MLSGDVVKKRNLNRELKLQKRAAGVILFADSDSPFVQLLNKFKWIPF